MTVLPPGSILQLLYLQERLKRLPPGRFIEIGPGSGEITKLLLNHGWVGCSFDLGKETIDSLSVRFKNEIANEHFSPIHADFITVSITEKVDLIISCMVMEHLDSTAELAFMAKSSICLKPNGIMMGLIPASPSHWGIEDDIAGHCRRYTRSTLSSLLMSSNWTLLHLTGLTFPLSNLLLPISNWLVVRGEKDKLSFSTLERTVQSGRRRVKYKTYFPAFLGILLNPITLFPLHLLQKLLRNSQRALVLFFEAKPNKNEISH